MGNPGLYESQAGIKISWGNINSLRYADDTTVMAEGEEELKSLLMRVKEESEKAGLKHNIQKTQIMASGLIQFSSVQVSRSVVSNCLRYFMANRWEKNGNSVRFYFGGLHNHCGW